MELNKASELWFLIYLLKSFVYQFASCLQSGILFLDLINASNHEQMLLITANVIHMLYQDNYIICYSLG